MLNVITDVMQSAAIIVWCVMWVLMHRRIRKLESRSPATLMYYVDQMGNKIPPPSLEEPKAICGCGHHQCFHDETGCGKVDMNYYQRMNTSEREPVPCGCKRYTGPEQLPQVIP